MKVYFAGSIRGGRVDAELYRRMIEYIQRKHIVLTEHIGSPDLNLKEQGKKDCQIYDQDCTKTHLSAMLTGNPYFNIHPYTSESDIYPTLDSILG